MHSAQDFENKIYSKFFLLTDMIQLNLPLIGMRGDIFISLSSLDQILSAEFFWRWILTSVGLVWNPFFIAHANKSYGKLLQQPFEVFSVLQIHKSLVSVETKIQYTVRAPL